MTSPRITQRLPNTARPDAVEPTYIPELSADRISTGSLEGTTITVGEDGVIKAGMGSTTVEIVAEGIYGYVDNIPVFRMADGQLYVKGTIEADDGYFKGTVSAESLIAGADIVGATIAGGVINGVDITGSTFTGAGGRFSVDASGKMTASGATITGSISGSTITGSTITGGSLSTADVGNPRVDIRQLPSYGAVRFYANQVGETPSMIRSRTIVASGGATSKSLEMITGVDGASGVNGPELLMNVNSGPGGSFSSTTLDTAWFTVTGELRALNAVAQVIYGNNASDWDPNGFMPVACVDNGVGGVHLSGLMKTLTQLFAGAVLFRLPGGYTPAHNHMEVVFATANSDTPCRVDVQSNGLVVVAGDGFLPANTYVPLNFHYRRNAT